MSEIDEDFSRTSSISLHRSSTEEHAQTLLIPINARNSNSRLCDIDGNSIREGRTVSQQNALDNAGSVNNNEHRSPPGERGTTSLNPRSKRPKPKPSAALLEAKRNALARKIEAENNPQPEISIMKDHLQAARDSKDLVRKRTGVVYDMKMVQHRCLWDPEYPEKPERFEGVINRCEQLGLLDRCLKIAPRPATKAEILSLHSEDHIEKLQSICKEKSVEDMEEFSSNYDAVYMHPTTYDLSLLSVGCTVDLVNAVVSGHIQNGMAIIRPPGHHAMKSEYCGYCYFNNVAIAAKNVLDRGKASRVLIVDFDVHHGQATQQMFYDDPRVLYFSTHRYEHGNFWPNLEESDFHYIGSSNGVGFNCNVPLNKTGLGNADFLTVWHQLLLPLAHEFNPELVIVSAGFDCVYGCFEFDPDIVLVSAGFDSLQGDEKGEMELTPQCCPHLIWPLLGLAGGKVAVVLEGGYNVKSLSEGAALTLRALLGDPCPAIPKIENPSPVLVDSVLNLKYMLKTKWNMLIQESACKETEENIKRRGLLHIPKVLYEWDEPKPTRYATRHCYPVQDAELIKTIDDKLDKLSLSTNLTRAVHKVGIVYDNLMLKHRDLSEPGHPERPERISNIHALHAEFGLLERCLKLTPREATEEELSLVHTEEHIRKMKETQHKSSRDLYRLKQTFNSIFFNNFSYQAALIASGSVLEVVDNVLQSNCQSGVAIVRPPGHHAEEEYPHGFCIFNNVAVAAKYAITNHGLKRILIVDWDVHHGNGIQRMFEDDPRVLYISIHRYDNGSFFPCSEDANYNVVGRGNGTGFTVNIPWNAKGMGDTEYLATFTNVILPIAYEFSPELVLVSAGFDAARGDPLGGCKVSPEGYAQMTHLLSSLANGKVILALEGGYNLTSIAYSMSLCTKALLGDPIPALSLNKEIHPDALNSIQNVLDVHSQYWTVLKPFRTYLPQKQNLIPIGRYCNIEDAAVERMANMELKNNNFRGQEVPLNINSKISLSPERINSAVNGDTRQSPEAMTMTLLIGDESLPDTEAGACGGIVEEAIGGQMSKHEIVLSNLNASGCAAVVPAKWCPHLEQIQKVPYGMINASAECQDCGNTEGENWICLSCYSVHCSRFVNEHMMLHSLESEHRVALSLADLSVWCYSCDTYVDNEKCREAIRAAYMDKFGEEPPARS